jgi:hypothetical protein
VRCGRDAAALVALVVSLDQLEFQRVPHVYLWRGRELDSVTKIMRRHGLGFQGVAPQGALDRGIYVHEALPLIGEWSAIPEDYAGYCHAAEAYLSQTETRITHSELPLVHPELGYCGTPDAVVLRKGRRGLIEAKTGDASDWDVQAAAYVRMWERWFPNLAIEFVEGVKLNDDGTYRTEDLDIGPGWNAFAACLVLESRTRRRAA